MAAHEHLPDLVVTAINSVSGDSEQLLVFLRKWTGASERELLPADSDRYLGYLKQIDAEIAKVGPNEMPGIPPFLIRDRT